MSEDEVLTEVLTDVFGDVLSLCDAWLLESMGIARGLNAILDRCRERGDAELGRWAERALVSVRGVHALLEYNMLNLGNRQAGREAMQPDFRKQKTLSL